MIGIVVVSHSRVLAKSLADLVKQIIAAAKDVPIAYSGGAGEDHQEFGTDALEIMEAIQSVAGEDGVLVLMDLGSAVLSAEMALDLLPPEISQKVMICPAALVEGAISAGVQASMGSDLKTAFLEAQQSLLPKLQQLGGDSAGLTPVMVTEITPPGSGESAVEAVLDIRNTYGLHARPAAQFVQTAAHFDATIQVINLTNGRGPVSAKSLNALATLGAVQGHQIKVIASGAQATPAMEKLRHLVEDNFGESTTPPPAAEVVKPELERKALAPAPVGAQRAIPIAEGIALAALYHYQPPLPPVPDTIVEDAPAEWQRLQQAIAQTHQAILERRKQTAQRLGEAQAAIFDAHLLILKDPDLLEAARLAIFDAHKNAAAAWFDNVKDIAAQYAGLDDPYLKQRSADVMDVGNQVLYALAGEVGLQMIELPHAVILVADELTPTQTATLDLTKVLGIATVMGGTTSHSAILARSLGIPAISGIPDEVLRRADGTLFGLNGFEGFYWIEPSKEVQADLEKRRSVWLAERQALLAASTQPAFTQDGQRVEVAANVGSLKDAQKARENGAEGVGLLRTEFLFLTRQTPPNEEEQFTAMRDIGKTLLPHPVVVRTLDVGGDKPLPYVEMPPEANPFLGVRAVRLSLQRPDLFQTQLRAILRAANEANLRVMFPMIAGLEEIRQARQALLQAHEALEREGVAHRYPVETGIMVEIPSSALLAPVLAKDVDFFSIGTNDLTQYTLAAERGNPSLAYLTDALNPAVLSLIQRVVQAAHANGKWVGVCGELAGDVLAVPVLVGLGVDELSLNPAGIPRVKALVRKLRLPETQKLADQVLNAEDASAARCLAKEFVEQYG